MARTPVNLSRLGQEGATPTEIKPDPVYTSGALTVPDPNQLTGAAAVRAVVTGQPVARQPAPYQPATPPGVSPPTPAPVSPADRVRLLQMKLKNLGANLGSSGPNKDGVDGVLGPRTQAAMTQYHLDVNGNPVAPPGPAAPGAPSPAPGPASPAAPPAATPQDIEAEVRTKYGYLGSILLDNPEIHNVLVQAVQNAWDQPTVTGALMNTNYWKTTSDAVRQWDTLVGSDPASAQARVEQKREEIVQQAAQLGISIDPGRVTDMATSILRYGVGADGQKQMIGSEFHYQPGAQQGSVGKAEVDLKALAGQYFVPLSDQTLADWEGKIAQGMATPDDYQNRIIGMAKSAYRAPWIQSALDGGDTMQQVADPYRQQAAKDLGIDPASIDFTQPQWQRALTAQDDKGNPVGMDLATWQYTIRKDPSYGFQQSATGRQMAYDAVANLEQTLGKIAR